MSPPAHCKPVRVLIVDDHESVRAGLQCLLSTEADFEIVGEASSVPAALRAIEELAPEIVLLDFGLGAETGDRVLDVLATMANAPRVVILSMEDERVVGQELARRGAAAYVMKEEPTTAILAALQHIRTTLRPDMPLRPSRGPLPSAGREAAPTLTKREREVLLLVKSGLPSKSIARRLSISDKTVDVHKHQLRRKLGLRNDIELARHAALFATEEAGEGPGQPRDSRRR